MNNVSLILVLLLALSGDLELLQDPFFTHPNHVSFWLFLLFAVNCLMLSVVFALTSLILLLSVLNLPLLLLPCRLPEELNIVAVCDKALDEVLLASRLSL